MMMGYGISQFETPLIVRFFIVVFVIIFILFLTVFVLVLVRGVRQAHRNNQSPVLVIEALVVSKRQHISRTYEHLSTSYYATFEAETGSHRFRPAGRGRPRPPDLSGHTLSWLSAALNCCIFTASGPKNYIRHLLKLSLSLFTITLPESAPKTLVIKRIAYRPVLWYD